MGRITNEQLRQQINELYKKLPNGDLKLLKVQVLEIQDDVRCLSDEHRKLTKRLYNPDDGIVVSMRDLSRLTQEMHNKLDQYFPMIDKMVLNVTYLERFRAGVVRALWISYAGIGSIMAKLIFWE